MIHYHGMPLGGPTDEVGRFLAGRHALVSFAYPACLPVVAEACQSFVLDNGAFTAWKRGEKPDWSGYAAWVKQWHRHPGFDWCLIPDVIDGDWRDNLRLATDWTTGMGYGIESVPVWHLHEPLDYLRILCGGWRRVALGSSGRWANPGTDGWWGRMKEVMAVVCDESGRPMVKLHGLRMLNPSICERIPLSSADSTNAAQNNGLTKRFGMYAPPRAWQRAAVIADRIEACAVAPAWSDLEVQGELWEGGTCER